MFDDKLPHVLSQGWIVHDSAVRRAAMVSKIDRISRMASSQSFAHALPIIERAQQAVQDDQRRAFAPNLEVKMHECYRAPARFIISKNNPRFEN